MFIKGQMRSVYEICDTQLKQNYKLSRTQYAYPVLDLLIYVY